MLVFGIIGSIVIIVLGVLLLLVTKQLLVTKEKLKEAQDNIERTKLDYEHQIDLAIRDSQHERENFAVKYNAQKEAFDAERENWLLTKKALETNRIEDKALTAIQIKSLKEEFSVLRKSSRYSPSRLDIPLQQAP